MQEIIDIMKSWGPVGPDTRIRVDLQYGYISYAAKDWEKALAVFFQEGLRLRVQRNIYDDGRVVFGNPFRNDVTHGNC